MEYYNYLHDPIKNKINNIDFKILSSEEVYIRSVLKNNIGLETYELYDNDKPKKGGLLDIRLGVSSNDMICDTCGFNKYCPGHFGHIILNDFIINIGYIEFIKKILDIICLKCSNLLQKNDQILNLPKHLRINYLKGIIKNLKTCVYCGTSIKKIITEIKKTTGIINIYSEIKNNKDNIISEKIPPNMIFNILENISDEDCIYIGIDPLISRPENMLYHIFPLPPVQLRPSPRSDFTKSSYMENELTQKLADIFKANKRIIKSDNNTAQYNDFVNLLQYQITYYIDSDMLIHSDKLKKFNSISTRIKGKHGRVRINLMGKRVNFSGRTVITPDPGINCNELGVPLKIAMILTIPEIVNEYNINNMYNLIKNGKKKYPGANTLYIKKNKTMCDLEYIDRNIKLEYGDIVERHLINGDWILFNRQPTLHKQSMMAHKIKIIKNTELMTFRLSVSVTTPYNADFDGDEMNIFIPQNIQTRIELENIANVKNQFISSSTSKSIIGIVQDGLIGSYNLSNENEIDWQDAMNILSCTKIDIDNIVLDKKNISGNELFSYVIPKNINLKIDDFEIKNGNLLSGNLSKNVLGANKNNTIHKIIWDKYNPEITKIFIDNVQRVANKFNLINGFTVGYSDTYINKEILKQIDDLFKTNIQKTNHDITFIESNPDLDTKDNFEFNLFNNLNIIRDDVSKLLMNNISKDNNFSIMINSGSKGDIRNIGQMIGCVGLQAIEGGLVPKKYNQRTLSYFHRDDDRPYSRGLIKSSFIQGLKFSEFVFHMSTSRDSLIDGSIKTADTGYIQRKLTKYSEDIMIKYDCTVRNANDDLIQIAYGGINNKQYEYDIEFLKLTNDEIYKKYDFKNNGKSFCKELIELKYDHFINNKKSYISEYQTKFNFFVNINAIIEKKINNKKDIVDPNYVYKRIKEILENKYTTFLSISNTDKLKIEDEKIFKHIFKMILYDALSPVKCIEYNFNKEIFDKIIDKIIYEYNKNIIQPGEMIGIITAQSLGEPLTQMSCHRDTMILVKINDNFKYLTISELIDKILIKKNIKSINNSYICDVDNIEIMSVDENQNSKLKKISQISKHPVNGKLIKIRTQTGRETITTLSHSHLKLYNNKIIPIKASELKINDKIPILIKLNNENIYNDDDNNNGYDMGYYCNIFYENIFNESLNYITNYLKGYILRKNYNFEKNIIFKSNCIKELNMISILLTYYGIYGKFENNKYIIDKNCYFKFNKIFLTKNKSIKDKTNLNIINDVLWDSIVFIEIFEENGYVYDFTVPGNNNFMVDNNILVHNTLNAFHHSGIAYSSTIIHGVPRIKEILSVSKNIKTPQMIIYLKDKYKNDEKIVKKISCNIVYTILKDIRKYIQVYYEPLYDEKDSLMNTDKVGNLYYEENMLDGCQNNLNGLHWVLRIVLDHEKMINKEISLDEIKKKFCNFWNNRFNNLNKNNKNILNKINNAAILSTDNDNTKPIIHIRFNAKDYKNDIFDKKTLNNFITYIIDDFKIKGVNNITDIYNISKKKIINYNKEDESEYIIYAKGFNLIDLLFIKKIDLNRTISNDIYNIYLIYGIEIARSLLIDELIYAYEKGGHTVNLQIIFLLADKMTFNGNIVSIDRHGIEKSAKNPISKASYEKTLDHFRNASFYNKSDDMNCISSRIAAGLVINGGTGLCDLLLDTEKIINSEIIEKDDYDDIVDDIIIDDNITDIFIPE